MPRSKIVLTVFIDSVDGMLDIWLEAVPPHELIPSQYELLAVNARDEVAVTQIFKHAFASLSELLWLVCKCDEVASERACFAIDSVRVSDGTRDVSAVANYVSQKINEATCDIDSEAASALQRTQRILIDLVAPRVSQVAPAKFALLRGALREAAAVEATEFECEHLLRAVLRIRAGVGIPDSCGWIRWDKKYATCQ